MSTATGPAWAQGYEVAELKQLAGIFAADDKAHALGAFSRMSEVALASAMLEGRLDWNDTREAAILWGSARVRTPVRDFTGEVRTYVPAGAVVVHRAGATTEAGWTWVLEQLRAVPPEVLWLHGWVESQRMQALVALLGLVRQATKIKASSELVGVWAAPGQPALAPLDAADVPTLVRLAAPGRHRGLVAAAAEAANLQGWADHYSSYNRGHAWSALGLTAYAAPGTAPDPLQIVKPAEMSKAWKAEHPDWASWVCAPTALASEVPAIRALLEDVALELGVERWQRVRLMQLSPGGGELTRHSDITDPEAGTADGHLARIHVPLVTNPEVRFRQWRLDGRQVEANMGVGTVWYLDTRKPHRAGNYGSSARIHLVADAYSTATLRAAIVAGEEAQVVPGGRS